jgi:hypothetical protein
VDPSGNIFVTGYTVSPDFPIIGPSQKPTLTGYDAFVAKFSPTGSLLKSTFLGGNSSDYAYAIASDATGVYVGGFTYSSNFLIIGGFRPTIGPTPDAFVAKLDPSLSTLLWSSFVGGNDQDYIYGIAVDSASPANVYITGQTWSSDLPLSPSLYPNYGGGGDAFLMKLTQPTPNSVQVAWSTYLGGSNYDFGTGVCVTADAAHDPVAVGYTYSYTAPGVFPTTPGAYKTSALSIETYVTRVKSDGSGVVYSTFLGGNTTDYGRAIAPGGGTQAGTVYVTGQTFSSDFPFSATAYKKTASTTPDAFVSRLSADGKILEASTYVSGSGTDDGKGIVVLSGFGGTVNGVYVTGNTTSPDLPLPPPPTINRSLGGQQDAFLTKFSMDLATCSWTTFVGGSVALADSQGTAIAIDPSTPNMIYVTGYTTSLDFPVQAPAPPGTADLSIGGTQDVFIAKILTNAGGAPVVQWSTYLGGSQSEWASAIAVDSGGFVYVVGQTTSPDFPLVAGPGAGGSVADNVFSGGSEAFVTQLQPNGTFYYSTFLGGSGTDYAKGIAVDSGFNAFITGYTTSSNFPLLNAFKTIPSTLPEVFVVKLSVNGLGLWSSYLGGSSSDYASGIACDQGGTICYVTGYTYSTDFPATVGGGSAGAPDVFVTAIQGVPSPGPAPIVHWSRYLGGLDGDYGFAIAVNPAGTDLYAVGYTWSNNFPTVNAFRPTPTGLPDSFVTKLVPGSGVGAGNIVWSTYLGGGSSDYAQAACVDAAGNVYVAGFTYSWDYPNKGAFQPGNNGGSDGFVTKIKADGSAIVWSSQIGGSSTDEAHGVAVDSNGVVYLTGFTQSNNFPYVNGIENVFGGTSDAFIVRLDNANPDPPDLTSAGLGQFKTTGGASIVVGGFTNDPTFQVKAKITDSDEDKVKLQVEIRPVGIAFNEATMSVATNTLAETGGLDLSGSTVTLTVPFPGAAPANFHWRARTVDNSTGARKSAWVTFGGNSDTLPAAPDIGFDTANPSISITPPPSATHYTKDPSIVLSGPCGDDFSGVTSVTWQSGAVVVPASGLCVVVNGNSWNSPSINLAVGQNVITIKHSMARAISKPPP